MELLLVALSWAGISGILILGVLSIFFRVDYNIENSRVAYFNDVALYDGISRVNLCSDCDLVYSNYVRYRTHPCPRCNSQVEKINKFAHLYSEKGNLLSTKKVFWGDLLDDESCK